MSAPNRPLALATLGRWLALAAAAALLIDSLPEARADAEAPQADAAEAASTPPALPALPALPAAPAPSTQLAAAVVTAAAPAPSRPLAPPAAAPAPAPADLRFDLSVNNAPAAQVFLQLAQGTPFNMLVSPEVSGSVSVTLKNTTVPEALDTFRELFGYDYRIVGNRIFVYSNAVQTRLYRINYLPGRRQGASDVRVSSSAITQQSSGTGGQSGSGAGGGSAQPNRASDNAQVRTTSDADFWREVQASLAALVGSKEGRNVVLNPAAGVVVVKATPAELRQVEQYLKAVQLAIERQVMLEAKIVEVQLSKDTQTGINWSVFGKVLSDKVQGTVGVVQPGTRLAPAGSLTLPDGTTVTPGGATAASSLGRGFYGLAFQAANFAALLNFLETQGDVTVLSSPRIATLNNQKAVLKVGSDELYVTGVSTSTTSSGSNTVSSPSVTLTPFFSGISLDVTPHIDDQGNVMLHVHPTVSTVTEKQKNIDLGSLGAFKLPLAASAVNETDSIVRVRDGQIVAIGGLMKNQVSNERSGVPGLKDTPLVGNLFRQSGAVSTKRELVILLKPTIIGTDGAWPGSDLASAAQARIDAALPAPVPANPQ